MDIYEEILKNQIDQRIHIIKSFDQDIEKARGGVYTNTPENRRLGRVGQKFGSKKEPEKKESTPSKKPLMDLESTIKFKEAAWERAGRLIRDARSSDYSKEDMEEEIQFYTEKRARLSKELDELYKQQKESSNDLEKNYKSHLEMVGKQLNKKPYSPDAVETIRMSLKKEGVQLGKTNQEIDKEISEARSKYSKI